MIFKLNENISTYDANLLYLICVLTIVAWIIVVRRDKPKPEDSETVVTEDEPPYYQKESQRFIPHLRTRRRIGKGRKR